MDYVLSHGLYVPEIWLTKDIEWLEVSVRAYTRIQLQEPENLTEDSKLLLEWGPIRIKELRMIRLILG